MNPVIPRRRFINRLASGMAVSWAIPAALAADNISPASSLFSVRDFGVAGDGKTLETARLQKAIDACAQTGGGTVFFPAGAYLTGTLFLRSHINIHLDAGAVLLGSTNLKDYPSAIPKLRSYTDEYTERSLIYGENLENISFQGHGMLNGQGSAFTGPYKVRPYLVRLISCRQVSVRDITFKDSPMWVQHYLACDDVNLDGITVESRCNHNNDGIDIDACQQVTIANCRIASGDDAIVLKSTLDRACKNITITNCVLSSDCNALKMGTESNGGFQNIAITNCALHDTRLAGLALEMVDGGFMDLIRVSNLTMRNVNCPIFVRLGNRARPFKAGMAKPGPGQLRNVSISHVQAVNADRTGCSITGLPDQVAENISLEDIQISVAGGGRLADYQRIIPENPEAYPEYKMFGILPAHGFFCRHVKNLSLSKVQISQQSSDERPSLFCDDVEGLEISRWQPQHAAGPCPVILLKNVRQAHVDDCICPTEAPLFLRIEGGQSRQIRLQGNHVAPPTAAVEFAQGASREMAIVDSLH